ncbi:hypothetical protein JRQ81_001071 [Phrynocephalus forsythii]|uniref:Uncharacterized protein n=1 Tax=Phrynocephalus forsythii TaxID=171643 RepID=A0A9Q1B8M6_9SAUR|nr:hypothetical protein JRQ81_001071 [Phrynocephalus forsythii]
MNMSDEDAEKEDYNGEINKDGNNEMNKPESSDSISPAIKEEALETTITHREGEAQYQGKNPQPDITDSIRDNATALGEQLSGGSQQPIGNDFQRSRPSVGQYSLRSPKSLQERRTADVDTMDSKPLTSRRTGKELQHKFNQTSLIWEKKPLAEVLQLSSKATQGASDATEAKEDELLARCVDNDKPSFHQYFQSKAEETIHGQPLAGRISIHDSPLETITESDHSLPTPAEKRSCEAQNPAVLGGDSIESIEHQAPEGQMPSEWHKRKETIHEKGPVWISQKTGKEVRSTCNQTSLIWEKKPLAHILEKEASNPDENLQAEIQALFRNWPSDWPRYYDY